MPTAAMSSAFTFSRAAFTTSLVPSQIPLAAGFHDLLGPLPDLHRVVFHPTRLGEDLLVLLLSDGDDLSCVVEDHEASARGPLVDRRRVFSVSHLNSFA